MNKPEHQNQFLGISTGDEQMTHQASNHSTPIDREAEGTQFLKNFANHLPFYIATASQRN